MLLEQLRWPRLANSLARGPQQCMRARGGMLMHLLAGPAAAWLLCTRQQPCTQPALPPPAVPAVIVQGPHPARPHELNPDCKGLSAHTMPHHTTPHHRPAHIRRCCTQLCTAHPSKATELRQLKHAVHTVGPFTASWPLCI